MSVTTVGIGEFAIVRGNDEVIRTISLGSCVGIVLLDRVRYVTGLAHVVLPDSDGHGDERKPDAYFADLAIPRLLAEMAKLGSGPKMGPMHLVLIGGGRPGAAATSVFNIGERNVAAVRAALKRVGLQPNAEDVGGAWSRTVIAQLGDVAVTCPDRPPLHL